MLALQICVGMIIFTLGCYTVGYFLGKAKDRKFLAYADRLASEAKKRGPRAA